jgi:hypothetical protein
VSAILDVRADAVYRELAAYGPMSLESLTESLGWRAGLVDQVVDHLAEDDRVVLTPFDGWVEVDVPREELAA